MRILAISHDLPDADWNGREELLREEATHVWSLQQAGIIREIWFAAEERDAVIVLECSSVEEAKTALDGFPLVRERLIGFDVRQLVPYDGFERLFTA